jgi:hypothetical protein
LSQPNFPFSWNCIPIDLQARLEELAAKSGAGTIDEFEAEEFRLLLDRADWINIGRINALSIVAAMMRSSLPDLIAKTQKFLERDVGTGND